MTDPDLHHKISELVEREHTLRRQLAEGAIDSAEEQAALRQVEESLDQCWDLLRQRDALRAAGRSPETADARPVQEVEGYLQ
jgi:hypothetical protein